MGGAAALAVGLAGIAEAAAVDPAETVRTFLEKRVEKDPDDTTALNRLSAIYLGRFRASGRFEELDRAAKAAAQSLKSIPAEQNAEALAGHARTEAEYHRFGVARDEGRRLVDLERKPAAAYLLLGDALFELGQLDEALNAWKQAAQNDDIPLELSLREARLHWLRGELDSAAKSYDEALKLGAAMSPPQTQTVVWAHVQRGQMAFMRGDWESAERDYLAAAELAPKHFTVLDHLAELRAAQQRFPEAFALYERVVASTGNRPEFMQALGDVQAATGNAEEARRWHDRALAGFTQSARAGNDHYDHHLAGFFCDVQPDPPAALEWARKDLALRQSVYAYDALAWALYANGEWKAAAEAAERSLALGTPDPHLLYHAGMIFSRAGDLKRGGELLRRVAEVNPRYYNSFHEHR